MSDPVAPRVRVVGWSVQPVLMVDDGENLTPLKIEAQMIPAAKWDEFKDGGDADAVAGICQQVEASMPPQELSDG